MKRFSIFILSSFLILAIISCSAKERAYKISVTNTLDIQRSQETIEIPLKDMAIFSVEDYNNLMVVNGHGQELLYQLIDVDQNSEVDHIIFQSDFAPKQTQEFLLQIRKGVSSVPKTELRTFCRIVPERIDDFAWENDKVAFRTYGPKCQEMFENGVSGGLISSGMDCWAKRVNYPIIDKWYKAYQNGVSYHQDHGEGVDAYHVGTTRGCGGIAIVENNKNILSKNFISWEIIANGPIRSIFELKYAPIKVGTDSVAETKRITLDLGTNLYHCKVSYTSEKKLSMAAIGLALHQKKGNISSNSKEGWASYWEPMAGSEIGTGIVVNPEAITNVIVPDTLSKDESFNNIWANVSIKENNFEYWAGFGWKKSGDFNTASDWEQYLRQETVKKQNLLQISITKI